MRFFADENFIRRAVDLLKAYDNQRHTFSHLLDHFPRGTPDLDWLPVVADWDPRPLILSGDGRILRNKAERAALRDSGCTYVFLAPGWTNTKWDLYGQKVVTYWPRVREQAARTTHQAIIELTLHGTLQRKPLPG